MAIHKDDKVKILCISGPSGTGKTYLAYKLQEEFPEMFFKLSQVTTRDKRDGETQGDPYIFLDEDGYDDIKDDLICRVMGDNKFGSQYGTVLEFKGNDVYHIVIASQEGIEDLLKEDPDGETFDITVIGIKNNSENFMLEREGRNPETVKAEMDVLEYADVIMDMNSELKEYVDINDIYEYLKDSQ